MNVHSTEAIAESFSAFNEENATLKAYLRETIAHLKAAATNMDKEDMPWSARDARRVVANAERYLEQIDV